MMQKPCQGGKIAGLGIRSCRSQKMIDVSESLRSITKNEQCEQFAQFAHQKLVTMSESFRSLICSQKTSDSLRKPISEFPALFQIHRLPLNEFTYPWTVRGVSSMQKKIFFSKKVYVTYVDLLLLKSYGSLFTCSI